MNHELNSCVATVGFFDGVHAGHRFLIDELKAIAKAQNKKSVVITFATHPRKVLDTTFQPELLNTLSEKIALLESTGVDSCIVLEFTPEMAKLSANEFIKTVLWEKYHVSTLLVGHDHRFGHNRTAGFNEYKEYGESLGMAVIQEKQYFTAEFTNICSSEIRLALLRGEIETANKMLTYHYSLQGQVMNGFKIGRTIGFPTANLSPNDTDKIVPSHGVYAVLVHWNQQLYKGMMNIGTRPTLENGLHTSLEVHILDFDEDIYNQTIKIEFIQKIRDEQKFNGIDALIEQLKKDKQEVLTIL
jgi:riboflavin kinase / FMN adenylyltransferase